MTYDECLKNLLDLCDTERWPDDERALAQMDRDIDAFLARHGSASGGDPVNSAIDSVSRSGPGGQPADKPDARPP
jgi:hypothetical protein